MARVPRRTLARSCPSEPPNEAPSAPRCSGDYDVLICGASFAGLAVARELAGSGARRAGGRPLRDRRAPDLRVRRARPSGWTTSGSGTSIRQTFDELVIHTPRAHRRTAGRCRGRSRRSTTASSARCWASRRPTCTFETAKVDGPRGTGPHRAHRPRRPDRAADRRRPRLAPGAARRDARIQPPDARLSRGLEVHPDGHRRRPRAVARPASYVRAGYCWASPPATSCASASARSTRATTSRSRRVALADGPRRPGRALPGQLDPPPAAPRRRGRHLLRRRQRRALPADDRRGHPHRAVLRPGLRPRAARGRRGPPDARAGARPLRARSPTEHASAFRKLKKAQDLVGWIVPKERLLRFVVRALTWPRILGWFFPKYMAIAPPEFALGSNESLEPAPLAVAHG